jgi:hypothetical protein
MAVQTGVSDATLSRPLYICFAERDEAEGTGATHWLVTGNVQLQSFVKDGMANHRQRIAWFEDLWQGLDRGMQGYDNLAAALCNHAGQFHCHGLYPEGAHATEINDEAGAFWVWTRGFRMSVQWVNGIADDPAATGSVTASGFGDPRANDVFAPTGMYAGQPSYTGQANGLVIWWSNGEGLWLMGTDLGQPAEDALYASGTDSLAGSWARESGDANAGTVVAD